MNLYEYTLHTKQEGFTNVTAQVREALSKSGIKKGLCVIYCPHTTAGITINENADPDVVHDMLLGLAKAYPDDSHFRHAEGNSAAHLRASALGSSAMVIVRDGHLALGQWQGIYFCEFDGPRTRTLWVKVMGDAEEDGR